MPFYRYDIHHSDNGRTVLYEALFWAENETKADDHIFHAVQFRAGIEGSDAEAAAPVVAFVTVEREDRYVAYNAYPRENFLSARADLEAHPPREGEEATFTGGWLVCKPDVHEMRPPHRSHFVRWNIADCGDRQEGVEIRPVHIDLRGLRVIDPATRQVSPLASPLATAIVRFLRERDNTWRSFTRAELRLWMDVNNLQGIGRLVDLADGEYIEFGKAASGRPGLTDETVVHVHDKFILTMFGARGILRRF